MSALVEFLRHDCKKDLSRPFLDLDTKGKDEEEEEEEVARWKKGYVGGLFSCCSGLEFCN